MSIIMSLIEFVGGAAASGITWDVIKKIPNLLKSLKEKFLGIIEEEKIEKMFEELQSQTAENTEVLCQAYDIAQKLGIQVSRNEFDRILSDWAKDIIQEVALSDSPSIVVKENTVHDSGKIFVANNMYFGDVN